MPAQGFPGPAAARLASQPGHYRGAIRPPPTSPRPVGTGGWVRREMAPAPAGAARCLADLSCRSQPPRSPRPGAEARSITGARGIIHSRAGAKILDGRWRRRMEARSDDGDGAAGGRRAQAPGTGALVSGARRFHGAVDWLGRGGDQPGGSAAPDLVVLDLGLPDVPGETVAREIRAAGTTPILMLTAKSSRGRPDRRAGAGRRRLRDQALQPPGAGTAGAGDPAARRGRRSASRG